jgi:hypothetical protein
LARLHIRAGHWGNRIFQPQLCKATKHFDIIIKAALAQRVPSDFAGGILPDERLFFFLGSCEHLSKLIM